VGAFLGNISESARKFFRFLQIPWIGSQNPELCFKLAKKFCTQLESEYITEESGTQIIKNLLFLIGCLIKFPQFCPKLVNTEIEENTSKNQRKKESGNQEKIVDGLPPAQWIFRRLSYMAKKAISKNELLVKCVFQLIGVISNTLPSTTLMLYLKPMLFPVYVYSQMLISEKTPTEVCENNRIAKEIVEFMKEKVGTMEFLQIYDQVQGSVVSKRTTRKRETSMAAVINPERHAKTRTAKNFRKKNARKRKAQSYSMDKVNVKVRKLEHKKGNDF